MPPRIWDISPPVGTGTPVFPGDAPFTAVWAARIGPGCPVNVSTLTFSPHTGAHADAPLHYDDAGAAIGALELAPYLGRCRVIHAIGCGPLVRWQHLAHAAEGLPERVLVRTYARAPVGHWDAALAAFAPETIERLADAGVRLVGIDTASIDPAPSKTLDSHQVIRRRDLRVLENLLLDEDLFFNTAWTFAPQISLPIFDSGRNQATLQASEAARDIAVAQYQRSIQTAFREVADALAGRATFEDQVQAQRAQVQAEQTRYRLADLRYRNGASSFLEVLDAQRALFQAQQLEIVARASQVQNVVTLYKALGGGWAP